MTVMMQLNADPPEDVATLPPSLVASGSWLRFSTDVAFANVFVPDGRPEFLLHWIESWALGGGTEVLKAIGVWADQSRLTGWLTCMTLELVRFYRRDGWMYSRPYLDGHAMIRHYNTYEEVIPDVARSRSFGGR